MRVSTLKSAFKALVFNRFKKFKYFSFKKILLLKLGILAF